DEEVVRHELEDPAPLQGRPPCEPFRGGAVLAGGDQVSTRVAEDLEVLGRRASAQVVEGGRRSGDHGAARRTECLPRVGEKMGERLQPLARRHGVLGGGVEQERLVAEPGGRTWTAPWREVERELASPFVSWEDAVLPYLDTDAVRLGVRRIARPPLVADEVQIRDLGDQGEVEPPAAGRLERQPAASLPEALDEAGRRRHGRRAPFGEAVEGQGQAAGEDQEPQQAK